MNRDRLNNLIGHYINSFDTLNNEANNENMKWKAVYHFKNNFDINAPDFYEMFKYATSESSIIINNGTVQPVNGILKLITHEEDTVRSLFAMLYQDNIHLPKPIVYTYELPSEENDDPYTIDATSVSIRNFFGNSNTKISFLYDFGEGWEISLVCEEIICDVDLPGKMLPRVIDGEGYGIIEDCGGTTGLEEFAAHFSNEAQVTIGTDLNPFAFDKEDMNFRLQKVPRIYRDVYEYQLEPTAQSMKILERKYKLK